MTLRVYLMPVISVDMPIGPGGALRPVKEAKYASLIMGGKTRLRYDPEPACLLIADTTAGEHAAVIANSDVRAFPDNLDTAVTNGARTAIVNALEALSIPAQWVANGQTFRAVLRRLAGILQLSQAVHGRGLRFLQASLDSPISALPVGVRQAMQAAAAQLEVSTTGITLSTTVRQALAAIGAQFEARPLLVRGVAL
jgi:hypothetical protein